MDLKQTFFKRFAGFGTVSQDLRESELIIADVLIVGAGLAGCVISRELALSGVAVTLIDTTDTIGGKVRSYGCKASDKCAGCGVCLTAGLWHGVEASDKITFHPATKLIDLIKEGDFYRATLKSAEGITILEGISHVVAATGFEPTTLERLGGFAQLEGSGGIITGSQLESLFKERTSTALFETPPKSIAFIQCYGSRDRREHADYCSGVCCAYSTRAAKAVKHFYPECRVVFFYMEMQAVSEGDYFRNLLDAGIEFVKCRPIKIAGGNPAIVYYDDPSAGNQAYMSFDMIVLSDGIRPAAQSRQIAEICGLQQSDSGFLRHVDPDNPGVLIAGCALGPKKIAETYAESIAVAKGILRDRGKRL